MPRNVSQAFKGWLQRETMQAAVLVLVTTPAPWSKVLGFTTWDEDIVYGGVTYEAQSAVTGSAVDSAAGTGVDNFEVTGLLSSMSITDADVYAGVYDRALLQMFVVNPLDLTMGSMVIMNGVLGDFKTSAGKFVVEFRSLTQLMSQQVGRVVGPNCDVQQFCDTRCGLNASTGTDVSGNPITSTGTIATVVDENTFTMTGIITVLGFYTYGIIKFITGLNAGIQREIKVHGASGTIVTANGQSTPTSPGNVPFNSNLGGTPPTWLTQCGTNFTVPVPPGSWDSGYLTTQELWTLKSMQNQGTNGLYVQLPTGVQYPVAEVGWSGTYQHVTQLGSSTMADINTMASGGGGNMSGCLQFWESTGQQLLNVNVQSLWLTLEGSPTGTSNTLQLGAPFPYPVSPGDTAYVVAGCDRNIATCANKWNNAINHRGFSNMPGTDFILHQGTEES